MRPLLRVLLITHAVYIFITALWPIVDVESFMAVTGPKTDVWLVKTVGALLIPVALTMMVYCTMNTDVRPLALLAGGIALSFIVIDVSYALPDIIPDIYLADAAVEFVFFVGWLNIGVRMPHSKGR